MNAQFRREVHQAAHALARAFQNDPLYTHVIPDPRRRARLLVPLMHSTLKHCVRHGGVETAGDGCGALGWVSGEHMELGLVDLVRAGMWMIHLRFGGDCYQRLEAHERACENLITTTTFRDFAYLWVAGVDPECQGEGVGGDLMRASFRAMEGLGHEMCLFKTEAPASLPIFEHLGFSVAQHTRVQASGIEVWVMQRFLRQRRRTGLPDPQDALRRPKRRRNGHTVHIPPHRG